MFSQEVHKRRVSAAPPALRASSSLFDRKGSSIVVDSKEISLKDLMLGAESPSTEIEPDLEDMDPLSWIANEAKKQKEKDK